MDTKKEIPTSDKVMVYNYIKTNDFQTKFVSGAFGSINSNGLINMDVFIDRVVIPQKVMHNSEILSREDGVEFVKISESPSQEIKKDGIVREVHTGLIFDVETAKKLVDWIKLQIQNAEHFQAINKTL